MDASSWIALGALVVSIAVFVRGEWNRRGERRDRVREDERRDEELRLMGLQVEGYAEDRLSERRADLVCRQGDRGGAGGGMDYYSVTLANAGKAPAHDVKASIADEDATPIGGDMQRPGAILPGELSPQFKVHIKERFSRDRSVRLFLRVAWVDGSGEREENVCKLEHV